MTGVSRVRTSQCEYDNVDLLDSFGVRQFLSSNFSMLLSAKRLSGLEIEEGEKVFTRHLNVIVDDSLYFLT